MVTFVEYILDPQDKPRSYYPKTIPSYINDGGYWPKGDNGTLIGVVAEGEEVPDTLVTYTLAELQARQRAIHVKHPMQLTGKPLSGDMTIDEVNTTIKDWVDERN